MQQTSLLAYASIKDKLTDKQGQVLDVIEVLGPINNTRLAYKLHWPINTVTPRVLELRRKGLVESAYIGPDGSGRSCHFWRAREAA